MEFKSFVRKKIVWALLFYPLTVPDSDDDFGEAVRLSNDGRFLAIGAPQIDQIRETGYVTIYEVQDNQVIRYGNVLFGLGNIDHFGQALAFSNDGSVLAVGAAYDRSGQRNSKGNGYVRKNTNLPGTVWSHPKRFFRVRIWGVSGTFR